MRYSFEKRAMAYLIDIIASLIIAAIVVLAVSVKIKNDRLKYILKIIQKINFSCFRFFLGKMGEGRQQNHLRSSRRYKGTSHI